MTILGLSFRGGVKEHGFSGTLVLASLFDAAGATTTVVDPLYGPDGLINLGLRPHEPGSSTDAVMLQAAHGEFRDASSEQFPGCRVVYDGRG
ncbi:MAG: hypothetical protein M5U19_14360 [Microthrixaceae bacterium]|nr:hypothetical protein [Microthrixaceae bacterium]